MALSIGELAGYLTLDDSKFEQGLEGAKGKFEKTGGFLKEHGKKIGMAAGAAVGAAVVAGVAANIDIGKANDKLAAQLGLNAKRSEKAGKVAANLYRGAWGDSMEDVNNAVGAVMSSIDGMSRASGTRLEKVTAKAMDFATAFEIDVTRAAQVAGQMVETGLAKNATRAFDLLTAASQKVPAALREDLLDAADEYGQFFAGLGYSGEEAFALLVDASAKGMYGIDKAGDAIKEFTIRSTDMSTASKDAYKAIGLNARDMADKILKGGDDAKQATGKIIDGLLGIQNPSKRANAAIALFGTPLEDLNVKDIPKFLESMKGMSGSMDDAAGASKRMGDTLNDNFATRIEGWKRQASGFVQDGLMAIVAGFESGERKSGGFMGAMEELGAFIKNDAIPAIEDGANAVKKFGGWVKDNQTPIKIIAGVIATLLIPHYVLLGIEAMKSAGKAVKAWLIQQREAIKTVAKHVWATGVIVAKWAWLGAKAMLHAAKVAAAWVLSMGPIAWVIAAVVGLVVVIVKNWDKIKDIIGRGWAWVKDKTSSTWKAVTGSVKGAWETVKDKTKTAALWVLDKMLWFAERILGTMAKAFGWAPGIGEKLKAAHEKVKAFREDVNAEMDAIKDEDVKVRIMAGKEGKLYGDAYGGGGTLPAIAAGAAHGGGGGMGGAGLIPKVEAPMSPVRQATAQISHGIHADAMAQAERLADAMAKRANKNRSRGLGTAGAPGSVLPRGSYRVGMPYLGYPGHYGADYPAANGTPVYAPWPGRVTASYDLPGSNAYNSTPYRSYGRLVKIAYDNGYSSLFAHLSSRIGRTGRIGAGTMVGRVGSTGNSTGPHLHAEFSRSGSTINPARLGLFDTGGLARGAGLMVKGPRPERVLSNRQTEAFERLVARLDQSGGTGAAGLRPIVVHDKSGDPVRTAREVARQEMMAGVV